MTYSKTLSLLATGAFVITACAPETMAPTSDGPGAGAAVLSQDFGSASMNNMNVQNVKLQMEMVKNLTRIFAAETPATINFAFNSAELDAEAQAALDEQAAWIIGHPDITFRVFGHTDKVGTNGYNRSLGQRRAQAAVNYLISKGVDRRKVEAVVSFGETKPLVLTEAKNRQNRRTVTEVKGFFSPGGVLDGKVALGIYNNYVSGTTRVLPSYHPVLIPSGSGVVGVTTPNTSGGGG